MTNRLANFLAAGLLAIMAGLALASIANDTLTFDEKAHIGAGYSYLAKQDYRLNPEHPPLIKDIAALPLMFLHLNFPKQDWENGAPVPWWLQYNFGDQLLYHSGNNPDQIMFFARLGPILILILLGIFLYFWAKKLMGAGPALFLLALFVFCPNFMANGRLVTTDVGASFGAVIATYFWLQFLKKPSWKNVIVAGLIFGIAMLLKFSLILLIPFFVIITLVYAWLKEKNFKNLLRYCLLSVAAGLIGLIFVIGPVYQFNIAHYPYEKQLNDTKITLNDMPKLPAALKNLDIFMAVQPMLRPWAQYLLGLEMATNRTGTGNTTYFMGTVSAQSRIDYFPTLYLFKVPTAFHVLTLIVLIWLAFCFIKNNAFKNTWPKLRDWILRYFDFFAMLVFLGIYWFTSLTGNLNIGLRHILPTFAFTYMLVVFGLVEFLKGIKSEKNKKIAKGVIAALLAWFVFSSLSIFPHYLAYYNELAGGPDNGYKIAVDSNLDWGQDLKRLDIWMQDNGVNKIYLDYFGGGDPAYYLGDKYINWDNNNQSFLELPKGSYFAVSANQMQGQRAKAVMGYDQPTNKYNWLDQYEPPLTKIGYSIFVYQIK